MPKSKNRGDSSKNSHKKKEREPEGDATPREDKAKQVE